MIGCTLCCKETDSIAPGSWLLPGGLFPHQPGNHPLFTHFLKPGALQSSPLPRSGSTALPRAAPPVSGLTSAAHTWEWWGKSTVRTSPSARPSGGWDEELGGSSLGGSSLNCSIPTAQWTKNAPVHCQGQPTYFFQRNLLSTFPLSPS